MPKPALAPALALAPLGLALALAACGDDGGTPTSSDDLGDDASPGRSVDGTGGVSDRDANIWLDVDTPGLHVIRFGMREDGLELDKFVMTLDPGYTPSDDGPPETRADD